MKWNNAVIYDHPCIAEIYDQTQVETDDVALLEGLIDGWGALNILEVFCGTGRMLLPLAEAGHTLWGVDQSFAMLDRAADKVVAANLQDRITLKRGDATRLPWPRGFDVIIMGGRGFADLASPEDKLICLEQATASLNPGGSLFLENDQTMRQTPGSIAGFPTGTCDDGTHIESTTDLIYYDEAARIARFYRTTTINPPKGKAHTREYIEQKHPATTIQVEGWLADCGFSIEQRFGDHQGGPYTEHAERAIFWARLG